MSAFKQLAGHAVQPIQGGPGLCALPCYLLAMGIHINLQIGLWTQTYMTSWSLPLTIGFWICWQHTTYLSFSIAIWATTLFAGTMAMAMATASVSLQLPSSSCNADALFQLCGGLFAVAPADCEWGKSKWLYHDHAN